ncbi:MAG TPA: helicase C-terminal domain-containing protein [Drouetiella sp.]
MEEDRSKFSIEDIFARLAKRLSGYEPRPQQLELAHLIERSFSKSQTGIFEAGTGTGKSLAALVPALLSGKKVVVSTATISLQEQYINKDIPLLKEIMPFRFEAALMKGRGNYLGLRRWEEHLLEQEMDDRLVDWVHTTEYGDISELDFVPHWETWNEINSDSDDCLRNKCPAVNDCFYFEAKKRAENADLVVVNHALLLADAASYGNILPPYDLLIVDEAHHLPEVATDAFGLALSNRGLRAFCSKAVKRVQAPMQLIREIEYESDQFFHKLNMETTAQKTRVRFTVDGASDLALSLDQLKAWLEEQEFEHLMDVGLIREKAKLKARALISTATAYIQLLKLLANPDPNWVVWIERGDISGTRIKVLAAPLDVAPFIQDFIFHKPHLESSVWMSATLATVGDDPFGFFKKTCGIEGHVIQNRVSSPFDYAKQSILYLPRNLPEPNHPTFVQQSADEIERILDISDGRAFVLFTSKYAMTTVFRTLSETLAFPCKMQGDMPRKRLIDWFTSTPNAVLFGTSSFWEGVSIDGDKLSCVIIDRIPFQVPDDPVHEARCDVLKNDPDASWFNDLSLPHATMRLKQGVGRLIRTHRDTGIVAILDVRLTTKRYGRQILECLPPMTVIRTLSGMTSFEEKLSQLDSVDPLFESFDNKSFIPNKGDTWSKRLN